MWLSFGTVPPTKTNQTHRKDLSSVPLPPKGDTHDTFFALHHGAKNRGIPRGDLSFIRVAGIVICNVGSPILFNGRAPVILVGPVGVVVLFVA